VYIAGDIGRTRTGGFWGNGMNRVPTAPRPPRRALNTLQSSRDIPDWEGVRVFLMVARHKSLRAAAAKLRQSVNVVRRRLDKLERQLGTKLVSRRADGVKLTAEGEQIVIIAARMEDSAFDLVQARDRMGRAIFGHVRLASTEGLGTWWIAPHLAELRRAHPDLLIDLHCSMRLSDVARLEADIAVQIVPPSSKDVEAIKLGRLHTMPFAAKSYIAARGLPKDDADLENHDLVLQISEQVAGIDNYDHLSRARPEIFHKAVITSGSGPQCHTISGGAGIGLLPTYLTAIGVPVVPVGQLSFRISQDIWLVYRAGTQDIPRVRAVIDWLIEKFSPRKYPWFGDAFIHPDDLPRLDREAAVGRILPLSRPAM
jgi:DNA-binding transcriptional LysR family regulator